MKDCPLFPFLILMLKNINYKLAITEDDVHYIEHEGNYFKVNQKTYLLLSKLKQNQTIHRIASDLNVDIPEINNAINQIKVTLATPGKQTIKPLFTLLNEQTCNCVGKCFNFLFHKSLFQCLCILSVISTSLYYFLIADYSLLSLRIGFAGYLFALMILMFVHELGHICAAGKYRLKNLKISVGVYFIWPIFYVKLNQQVLLSREKRIVVSAGGLYFQLIFNLLCIGLNFFLHHDLILLIINLNMALFLMNLVPVLILDGYWIYADLFGIENLNTKAKALYKIPMSRLSYLKNVPVALLAYAVIRLLATLFIYFIILYYLTSRAKYFPDMIYLLQEDRSIGVLFRAVGLVLPYFLLITYLTKIIYGKLSNNC